MNNAVNKIKKVVLREDLLAITGDFRKAIILNQFIYWSERVSDADKFIEKENEIARKNGEEEKELFYGWIYKTAEELSGEIMLGLSVSQVRRYINDLVSMGFISKRNNPKYKWDRTLQYRVNLVNIAKALKEKGYPLSEYKIELPDDLSNVHGCALNESHMENQSVPDAYAIPETTIRECNSDITNTENKDFILSNKEKETLPGAGKDNQTSAPNNYNKLNIYNIPPRTKEQKANRYNARNQSSLLNYKDEDTEKLVTEIYKSIYGAKENIFEDHDICLSIFLITEFFKKYQKYREEKHPMVTQNQAENILKMIRDPDTDMAKDDLVDDKEEPLVYLEMMEEHFKTKWGKKNGGDFNYRIMLFFKDTTQNLLYQRVKHKREDAL